MTSDVWDLYNSLSGRDLASLTQPQRVLLALCDLRQEVNAGGFETYLSYWGGNSAPMALDALPAVLGQSWADLLAEAMQLVGSPYPDDSDVRFERLEERLEDDPETSEETLSALDARFYALEASMNADARLDDFIRDNGLRA